MIQSSAEQHLEILSKLIPKIVLNPAVMIELIKDLKRDLQKRSCQNIEREWRRAILDLKKDLIRFNLYFTSWSGLQKTASELHQIVDPSGSEFPGDYAFPQFLTRSRKEFETLLH